MHFLRALIQQKPMNKFSLSFLKTLTGSFVTGVRLMSKIPFSGSSIRGLLKDKKLPECHNQTRMNPYLPSTGKESC